jgi:hypothetical protein
MEEINLVYAEVQEILKSNKDIAEIIKKHNVLNGNELNYLLEIRELFNNINSQPSIEDIERLRTNIGLVSDINRRNRILDTLRDIQNNIQDSFIHRYGGILSELTDEQRQTVKQFFLKIQSISTNVLKRL